MDLILLYVHVGCECAASPGQARPRHQIRRVLAAHTVIKPAPQFPPTREAPLASVPSLLPAPTPVGRITSGSLLALPSQPARPVLSVPHLLRRFHPIPGRSLPTAATAATSFCVRVWGVRDESKRILGLDDLAEAARLVFFVLSRSELARLDSDLSCRFERRRAFDHTTQL